jgi:hypothetical protein
MALSLSFTVTQSCDGKTLTFTETTGVYNVTTNPGGWGTPNKATTDCTSKKITITTPEDEQYEIDNSDTRMSVLPSSSDTGIVIINGADIGETSEDVIPDGVYIIDYECTMDDASTSTKRVYVYLDSQASCCVEGLFGEIKVNDCCCDDKSIKKAMTARAFLLAARAAGRCGRTQRANTLLELVTSLCTGGNCVNCN